MAKPIIDLVGQRFGRWVVLGMNGDRNRHGQVLWACRCDCGTVKDLVSSNLKTSQSCGCYRTERSTGVVRAKDLAGQRFGRWLVVSRAPTPDKYKQRNATFWMCRCDCGTEKAISGASLRYGESKSCGCARGEIASAFNRARVEDLSGRRFGKLVVIDRSEYTPGPRGAEKPRYRCQCDCGKISFVTAGNLKAGKTTSCGCMKSPKGRRSPNWRGGVHRTTQGYVKVLDRGHPNAGHNGYVLEHVRVMSEVLGRAIRPGETVHHKNGIRDDNRPENLELWSSKHAPGQRVVDLVAFARQILAEYGDDADVLSPITSNPVA